MKKIFLLFVAAALAACSAEPIETEGIDSLNAAVSGKADKGISSDAVEESLDFPSTLCVGEEGTFTFIFEGKRNGATNLKLDIYMDNPDTEEVDIDWQNIDKIQSFGEGQKEERMYYTFEEDGTFQMRYQIGGSPVEFSVEAKICDQVCAKGKGYWTNHGPINPGNQEDAYPDGGIMIGGEYYELADLQAILQINGNTGIVFKMKQHLITAVLNIANGVDGSSIAETIEIANLIIEVNGEGYSEEEINQIKNDLEFFSTSRACEDFEE